MVWKWLYCSFESVHERKRKEKKLRRMEKLSQIKGGQNKTTTKTKTCYTTVSSEDTDGRGELPSLLLRFSGLKGLVDCVRGRDEEVGHRAFREQMNSALSQWELSWCMYESEPLESKTGGLSHIVNSVLELWAGWWGCQPVVSAVQVITVVPVPPSREGKDACSTVWGLWTCALLPFPPFFLSFLSLLFFWDSVVHVAQASLPNLLWSYDLNFQFSCRLPSARITTWASQTIFLHTWSCSNRLLSQAKEKHCFPLLSKALLEQLVNFE